MHFQTMTLGERPLTKRTFIGFLTRMSSFVEFQGGFIRETLRTHTTLVGF